MSALLSRDQIREVVHSKCQLGIMNDLVDFVKDQNTEHQYWGVVGDDFVRDLCYLLIYKMILGVGVDKLEHTVRFEPDHKLNHSTIRHNLDILFPLAVEWAHTKIVPRTKADWDLAVYHENFPPPVQPVNLWMDSSDFRLQDTVENHEWISHKLPGIGIRVQFIMDGKGRILFIAGPFQPTQYDGFFLELYHNDIQKAFAEGDIIADNHYLIGTSIFAKGPTFYVNARETSTEKAVGDEEGIEVHLPHRKRAKLDISHLSPGEKQMAKNKLIENANHSHVRARVESVFGQMKNKFKVLSERHVDKIGKLFGFVVIASAINNMVIEKNSTLP